MELMAQHDTGRITEHVEAAMALTSRRTTVDGATPPHHPGNEHV
jgi:hypothetical protein